MPGAARHIPVGGCFSLLMSASTKFGEFVSSPDLVRCGYLTTMPLEHRPPLCHSESGTGQTIKIPGGKLYHHQPGDDALASSFYLQPS
jgi:hypothetical protein